MEKNKLLEIRNEIDKIDETILAKIIERNNLAKQVGEYKIAHDLPIYDVKREQQIMQNIEAKFPENFEELQRIYELIFNYSKKEQEKLFKKVVSDFPFDISDMTIAGPCSVESYEQLDLVAKELVKHNIKFLRAGAFKPRTSPFDFQGLGYDGVQIIKEICSKYNLISVSEVMSEEDIDLFVNDIDIIQIGARNMQNFALLKKLAKTNKPIILKRGLSATLEEWIGSANYLMQEGNANIIMCERGIRSYDSETRNLLDLSTVLLLKQRMKLPIIVDLSHSLGRKDIINQMSKVVKALDINGIMVEVHPSPERALSDKEQQLNFQELNSLLKEYNEN